MRPLITALARPRAATTSRPRARSIAAIGAAAALALTLAACAGTAPDAAAGGGGASGGELTTIRLQTPPFAFEAVEIAQRQGIFAKYGLDVETGYGGGDPASQVTKVVSGELDLVMSSGPDVVRAMAQGMPIVVTGGSQIGDTTDVPTDGILVAPDSPIQSWADLEGKNVGIVGLGNLPQVVNNIALEQNGVDPSSVTYVTIPNEAQQEAALNGQVDAILPMSVFYTKAVADGFRALGKGTQEFFPGAPQIVWIASTQFVAEHADALRAFNEAMDEANGIANSDHDLVRQIDHELTQLPPAFIDSRPIQGFNIGVDRSVYETLVDAMVKYGFLDQPLAVDDIVWSEAPPLST